MKPKHKQIATLAGLIALGIVVGLAGLFVAVLPQKSKAHDLDAQIATLQTQLVSLHAGSSHAPKIKAADLFALARAMPNTTDMPSIVLDLARAAAKSKVELNSLTPGTPVAQTDGAQAIPLQVAIAGSWNHIAQFLRALRLEVRTTKDDKLHVDGRLFVADSVQVNASPNGGINATLSLNAFTYGVAPTPTTSTDTTGTTTTSSSSSGSVQAAGSTG